MDSVADAAFVQACIDGWDVPNPDADPACCECWDELEERFGDCYSNCLVDS